MSARLMVMLAGAASVLVVLAGLYWKGRHDQAGRDQPRIEAAQAQAVVSGLQAQGERDSAIRVGAADARRDAASNAATKLTTEILKSEAAHAPLDAARAARLRANDRELCRTAPELAGCPSP